MLSCMRVYLQATAAAGSHPAEADSAETGAGLDKVASLTTAEPKSSTAAPGAASEAATMQPAEAQSAGLIGGQQAGQASQQDAESVGRSQQAGDSKGNANAEQQV